LKIKIIRVENSLKHGTFGVLLINNEVICLTLEPPWRDNIKNISCITAGSYIASQYHSAKHGPTFEIEGVDGRECILFHPGNTVMDTQGCVLPGTALGYLHGYRAVLNSRNAMEKLNNRLMLYKQFYVDITKAYDD